MIIQNTLYLFFIYQPLLLFLIRTLLLNCDTDSLFLSPSFIHEHLKNILHFITAYVMFKPFMLYVCHKRLRNILHFITAYVMFKPFMLYLTLKCL